MTNPGGAGDGDIEELEARLKALSFSNRLRLLHLLRVPRTIDEIHLTPSTGRDEDQRERPLTREAIRHHLERLTDVGIVHAELVQQADGHARKRYLLDESQLYAIAETLRRLSKRDAGEGRPRRTEEVPRRWNGQWPDPPRLLLVHGAPSNRAFALRSETLEEPRGWVIGRNPRTDVTLEYDPYVSSENSEILPTEDGFEVLSLRTSRNRTVLNETRLEPGESVPLGHGDVLRVGSSTLVFHER